MTKYINIISRKRKDVRLDPEDGLGQLAWKERSNKFRKDQINSGRISIVLSMEQTGWSPRGGNWECWDKEGEGNS